MNHKDDKIPFRVQDTLDMGYLAEESGVGDKASDSFVVKPAYCQVKDSTICLRVERD